MNIFKIVKYLLHCRTINVPIALFNKMLIFTPFFIDNFIIEQMPLLLLYYNSSIKL